MSEIYLYDSLSNTKKKFEPIDQNHVRIYACGPTVYNYAHIGNARMAVVFDSFVRLLRNKYPNVTYVSNITDIDDKIIEASIILSSISVMFDTYVTFGYLFLNSLTNESKTTAILALPMCA